jgi:hypothetical protein
VVQARVFRKKAVEVVLKVIVEIRDPTRLTFFERVVVNVCVADKAVYFKIFQEGHRFL